jgi:hypothetical protein
LFFEEDFPMNRFGFGLRSIVCAALLSAVAALAQQPAGTQAGPVPSAILAAKKIFVSNASADSGLIPSPFSYDPSRGYYSGGPDRVYNEFYAALKKSGQFEMVGDPSDADLVLYPGIKIYQYEPNVKIYQYAAAFRLVIYDRKTNFVLWTLIEPIKPCTRQKACDINFDDAIPALVLDFEKLTGKVPAAAH